MAADDREQLFEKALARHLRQSGLPVSSESASASCPDAETLAAYHERTLSIDELNQWKQHLVGCERCREILAQLELTDDIPVAISDPALDAGADVGVDVGARFSASLAQAAPSGSLPPQRAAASSASSSKTVALPSRRRYWQWIAPAGAIAAGLFVWIAWRENRPPSLTSLPAAARTGELARTEPPASPAPVPPKSQAESKEKRERDSDALVAQAPPPAGFLDEKKAAELREHEMVIPRRDLESGAALRKSPRLVVPQAPAPGPSNRALQQQNTAQQNERQQLDVHPSSGAFGVVGGARPPNGAKELGAAKQESAGAAPNAAPNTDKIAPAMPTSELAAPPQPAPVISAAASAQKASNKPAEKKDDTKLAKSGVSVESSQSAASLNYTAAIAATPERFIAAPGGKVLWKLGENGAVQRSTDSGETWQPQNTGITATLFAGSAPSAKVCWLAGSFGVVLLTTDGGAHWTKLALPVNSPVGEITATDARNATATLQSSTVRFTTSDGGQTWSLVKP